MQVKQFKNANGSYKTIVFDEAQMIPDPAYVRAFEFPPMSAALTGGKSEAEYLAMQETEAGLLYQKEFSVPATVEVTAAKPLILKP